MKYDDKKNKIKSHYQNTHTLHFSYFIFFCMFWISSHIESGLWNFCFSIPFRCDDFCIKYFQFEAMHLNMDGRRAIATFCAKKIPNLIKNINGMQKLITHAKCIESNHRHFFSVVFVKCCWKLFGVQNVDWIAQCWRSIGKIMSSSSFFIFSIESLGSLQANSICRQFD